MVFIIVSHSDFWETVVSGDYNKKDFITGDSMHTPTSATHQFKYQPEKNRRGIMYQYTKSNVDGSAPARVYIRMADEYVIDVWKFESHNFDAAHVQARMNWDFFSAKQLDSWVVTSDGASRPQARMNVSFEEAVVTVQIQHMEGKTEIGHFPFHIYNFDFISLNMSLPHWVNPESELSIGVVQPNFNPEIRSLLNYEGIATLKFIGNEKRNGTPCRKYSLEGQWLNGQAGQLWVSQTEGHIEDMEIPIPDNPDWDDFKFNLVSTQSMDDAQWEQFISTEIKKLAPVDGE